MTPRNKFLIPTMESERVDRIPLILEILTRMGIQPIIDTYYIPHGNHTGLSAGWLTVIFLTYIHTKENHKVCPIQEWVSKHHYTLERLTGQTISTTDFTDDRLGDVLRYLSADEVWFPTEEGLDKQTIRVYRLETKGPSVWIRRRAASPTIKINTLSLSKE